MGAPDMTGLATFALVGFLTIVVIFFITPPLIFAGIAWACVDIHHAVNVWLWAQGIWALVLGSIIAGEAIGQWLRHRRYLKDGK